jgi:tetratricopeptide (TPR) repeat protein
VCERVLGPAHPDTANSINNLGYLLRAQGDLAGARPYYERALAVCERVLGPAHPDTAYSLWWMAYLTQRTGNLADERLLYERALSIFRLRLGEQHSYTQAVQGNLAALLRTLEASQGGEAR